MSTNLVIVESPAKAKTIEKYLGKDFMVKSSYGHIRDLPSKGMNIDIEGGTFAPNYEVNDDKKKVVNELKKAAKGKTVWLASDEDREGEAIAWHICHALKLDPKKTKRIVFHEITKPAITKAVKNPRTVDQNLVDAQQARRILDRLVGYELSPVLWRKVQAGLSAGRVQSVAVRIIVERENEIRAHEAKGSFKVTAEFDLGKGAVLKAEVKKKFPSQIKARKFLEEALTSSFTVESLETKPSKKKPAAPFTTSTLQQEASRKLGFSVKQTMMVAQKLYEAGKITYMRTDSVNLSDLALDQAKEVITKEYGAEYSTLRRYKTKKADAQEAHEAIRPTDFNNNEAGEDRNQKRLYDLIWKRTVASQMAEALIEKTTAKILVSDATENLTAQGEVIKFPGFLEVYLEGNDDEDDDSALTKNMLPPINEGQNLDLIMAQSKETFTRPPARYTEASLVKKLEEEGIGRPSTYAPTISTIMNRRYVEKADRDGKERAINYMVLEKGAITETEKMEKFGSEKSKLFPTDLGEVVSEFLVKFFPDVVDYGFTRKVEEDFDEIAEGKKAWSDIIKSFYKPFHETVEAAGGITREEAIQARELGIDPKSGKPVIARIGRYGPMIQIGTKDDEEKPKFASVPKTSSMKEITFEEAMELFKLPRVVGKTEEGEEIKANNGRFGPYVQVGKLYASIKDGDPMTISLEEARELIKEKQEKEKNKYIQVWEEEKIQLLRGPYGIYIKNDKANVKIPKTVEEPEKLTLEEIKKIIKEAPAKKPRKKATKKK
jgi:DNA topoisomerase-1